MSGEGETYGPQGVAPQPHLPTAPVGKNAPDGFARLLSGNGLRDLVSDARGGTALALRGRENGAGWARSMGASTMTPITWRPLSLLPRPRHRLPRSRTARMLLAVLVIAGASRIEAASAQTASPDSLPSGAPPVRLEFLSDSTSAPSEASPPKRRITFDREFEWGKEHPSVFRPWLRYNRVQGLAIYGEVGRSLDRRRMAPRLSCRLRIRLRRAARVVWAGHGATADRRRHPVGRPRRLPQRAPLLLR